MQNNTIIHQQQAMKTTAVLIPYKRNFDLRNIWVRKIINKHFKQNTAANETDMVVFL